MPILLLSNILQAAPGAHGLDASALELIWHAGPVVQAVLLVLVLFSVLSWAVIAERSRTFRRARHENHRVSRMLRQTQRTSELRGFADSARSSPFAGLVRAAVLELRPASSVSGSPNEPEHLESVLRQAVLVEMSRLEQRLGILATTASATPFIGLFGTVWGIMNAFHGIGAAGSASLATVAPGISEALIATAAGLAAAIPAVVAYNHFIVRLRAFRSEVEAFSLELLRWCERVARPGPVGVAEGR